jgi:thiamine transport system substrate-binding protein
MVLSYTTSPAYHISAEGEDKYKAAIFPEGHVLQVEIAGITRTTDTPDLAQDFMRFILSEPFQSAIPERNWMYPARFPEGGLPAAFKGLPEPQKSFFPESESVAENRRAWVDEWLEGMGR